MLPCLSWPMNKEVKQDVHYQYGVKFSDRGVFTFMLQSVVFSTFSRSHWTASGVHEPTLTTRSAKQHFTAWTHSVGSHYSMPHGKAMGKVHGCFTLRMQGLTWGGMDTRSQRNGVGISLNSNTSTDACTPTSTNKMSSTLLPWRLVIWGLGYFISQNSQTGSSHLNIISRGHETWIVFVHL